MTTRTHTRPARGRLVEWTSQHRGAAVGLVVLVGLLLAGFFLPLPFDPVAPDPLHTSEAPSTTHWFGTDGDGFDVFSRTIASAQRDLPLAVIGTLASLVIGVPLGLLVSTKSRLSEWLMRGLDIFQAFPLVILAVAVVTLAGNRLSNVVLAIMIVNVPRFMRLIRSEALALRESRFIEAARAVGASRTRTLRYHILPNVVGVTVVQSALAAAQAIIVIAALSFLGVGVSPPDPSWGLMIQEGSRQLITGQWWVALFPGLFVLLAVTAFNLVADGLHDEGELRWRRRPPPTSTRLGLRPR